MVASPPQQGSHSQAARMRSEAKHARQLATTLHQEMERQRLIRYAEELEERASRLEQEGSSNRQADD